jgi:uncharacterized protein (UPF0261 family)
VATVLVIGTLDTKGPEIAYLKAQIERAGAQALVMDSGILGEAEGIVPDISRREVAQAAGSTIDALRNAGSRGKAVEEMLKGVRAIALDLFSQGRIHGVTSLGGAEGIVLATAAMKVLPIGLPKLVVSPIASGRRMFGPFMGTRDIMVMHSVVDILGLNDISCRVYDTVASAIAGAAIAYEKNANRPSSGRRQIAATMLGNTTRPLMRVRPGLAEKGFDLVIYHANGVGGPAMEEAIMENQFEAVIDYTLSEMAGNVAGGFHVGGEKRLTAAALADVPQLIVPGCVDFIVFGPRDEVPEPLRHRPAYYHNPQFTLVRLNKDEQVEVAADRGASERGQRARARSGAAGRRLDHGHRGRGVLGSRDRRRVPRNPPLAPGPEHHLRGSHPAHQRRRLRRHRSRPHITPPRGVLAVPVVAAVDRRPEAGAGDGRAYRPANRQHGDQQRSP